MRDHKPRAQKRQEYKQVVGLLVLVLAVAAVSFSLGVAVGRRAEPQLAAGVEGGARNAVAEAQKPAGSEASPEDAPKVNLTFYDTLPKGEETPLGSGINPPPQKSDDAPVRDDAPPAAKAPEPRAEVPEASPRAPTTTKEAPKPPPVTSGEYVVQVASFKSDEDARTLQTKLLGKGHRAFLQRVDLAEKGVWTRVYVGFFNSPESAKKVADRLIQEDKLSPMVRRRP